MQPAATAARPTRMGLSLRLATAAAIALVVSWVPIERAAACSCAMVELREAVAGADVAFVGRLHERVRGGEAFGFPVLDAWHWSVEHSRDSGLGGTVRVEAAFEDGANCGVSFGVGERWLVMAHRGDDGWQTNGCLPNRRLDGGDPEAEAVAAGFVPIEPGIGDQPFTIPVPILVTVGVSGVLLAVGLLAFRRPGVRA